MDPIEARKRIMDLHVKLTGQLAGLDSPAFETNLELIEAWADLDEWLLRGGFYPKLSEVVTS